MNANTFIKCIILAFILTFACSVFLSIVSAETNNHTNVIPIIHYNEKTGDYTNINQTINFKTDKFKGEHNNWSLIGDNGEIKCKFAKGFLTYDDSGYKYIISEKPCKSCPYVKTPLQNQSEDVISQKETDIILDEPLFLSNETINS